MQSGLLQGWQQPLGGWPLKTRHGPLKPRHGPSNCGGGPAAGGGPSAAAGSRTSPGGGSSTAPRRPRGGIADWPRRSLAEHLHTRPIGSLNLCLCPVSRCWN